jgi:hypothetical protein
VKWLRTLAAKDTLALCISGFALLTSFASFYFQFFHVRSNVTVAKVDFDLKQRGISADFAARLALINNGNRDVLVLELAPEIEGFTSSADSSPKLPLTLKPSEAQLVSFIGTIKPREQPTGKGSATQQNQSSATGHVEPKDSQSYVEKAIYLKHSIVGSNGYNARGRILVGKLVIVGGEINGFDWLLFPASID